MGSELAVSTSSIVVIALIVTIVIIVVTSVQREVSLAGFSVAAPLLQAPHGSPKRTLPSEAGRARHSLVQGNPLPALVTLVRGDHHRHEGAELLLLVLFILHRELVHPQPHVTDAFHAELVHPPDLLRVDNLVGGLGPVAEDHGLEPAWD